MIVTVIRHYGAAGALLFAVSVGGSSFAAAADCASLTADFDKALGRRDFAAAKTIEKQITGDAICSGRAIEVSRRRAGAQVVMAEGMKDDPSRAAERLGLLEDASRSDVNWIAAYALGELYFSQRQFAEAAMAFDRAIEIAKNKSKTPKDLEKDKVDALFQRSSAAKQLAANEESNKAARYVTASKGERGDVGGSLSGDFRGVTPVAVPLPINFETNEDRFTSIGRQAADELAQAIREQRPDRITLVGHTDERGDDAYNMRLSRARVEAVARYLTERLGGQGPRIMTEWRGEREPLQLDDASGLTQEDVWALNRRVELKRR